MEILFKHHKWMELTHGMTLSHFREDCSLSESSLQGFEHAGDVLELLAGELLGMVDDVVVHLETEKKDCWFEFDAIITFTLDGNGMSFNTRASYFACEGKKQ